MNNIQQLNEDSRSQLLTRAKKGDNYSGDQSLGRNRYERRTKSRMANKVREYNGINMDKFFKNDILDVNVSVKGETDDYIVRMSFSEILEAIQNEIARKGEFSLKVVSHVLSRSFNSGDVYIHCSCPDWKYRMSYWSLVNDISSNPSVEATNNGKKIANPYDTKGPGCKHALLVLSNTSWIIKVSSTIYNYVSKMKDDRPQLYSKYIFPAIYGYPYDPDAEVQMEINPDELANTIDDTAGFIEVTDTTDMNPSAEGWYELNGRDYVPTKDSIPQPNKKYFTADDNEISRINDYAKKKGQFKKGNTQGYRFTSSNKNDKQFNFDSLLNDSESEK